MKRLRALAEKRQKAASQQGRLSAQRLLGAADGYLAIAEALERQPKLVLLEPAPAANDDAREAGKHQAAERAERKAISDNGGPRRSAGPARFDAA